MRLCVRFRGKLRLSRVNPADGEDCAIRVAARNGHVEVVRELLQDERVNPGAWHNFALRTSCERGHLEIVQTLLDDPRSVFSNALYDFFLPSSADSCFVFKGGSLLLAQRTDPDGSRERNA